MAVLSLKVRIAEQGMVKTMQFDPSTVVYDACRIIREKMPEANLGQRKLSLANTGDKKHKYAIFVTLNIKHMKVLLKSYF